MKHLFWLIIAIIFFIFGYSCCTRKSCNNGYCSIEQKRLQSYKEYKRINRSQYYTKVNKVTKKYIDIKPVKEIHTAELNPKFR